MWGDYEYGVITPLGAPKGRKECKNTCCSPNNNFGSVHASHRFPSYTQLPCNHKGCLAPAVRLLEGQARRRLSEDVPRLQLRDDQRTARQLQPLGFQAQSHDHVRGKAMRDVGVYELRESGWRFA